MTCSVITYIDCIVIFQVNEISGLETGVDKIFPGEPLHRGVKHKRGSRI